MIVSDVSTGRNDTMRVLDKNDGAPRVGLAWRAKSDFVVRAGYGIFYGFQQVNRTASTLVASPPFLADERSVFEYVSDPDARSDQLLQTLLRRRSLRWKAHSRSRWKRT